jgi:hypothetical protein
MIPRGSKQVADWVIILWRCVLWLRVGFLLRSLCYFNLTERPTGSVRVFTRAVVRHIFETWRSVLAIKRAQFWSFLCNTFSNIELFMSISLSLMVYFYVSEVVLSNSYWFPTKICFVFLISLMFHAQIFLPFFSLSYLKMSLVNKLWSSSLWWDTILLW